MNGIGGASCKILKEPIKNCVKKVSTNDITI